MNQVFISNLKDDAFLPFKIGDEVTLYAEKHNLDQYNFFFQDEWKVRPNLTLNYGARWEINPPANTSPTRTSLSRHADRRDTLPATPVVNQPGAVRFVPANTGTKVTSSGPLDHALVWLTVPISNQVSCASLFGDNGKSVIRLGYGMAFDTISSFQVTAAAGRIPGLVQSCTTSFSTTTGVLPHSASLPAA